MSTAAFAVLTRHNATPARSRNLAPIALWAAQGALAAIFIFAGTMKFIMPMEDMQKEIAWSPWFMYFIGSAEIAGGAGLVVPGITKSARGLTPLAGIGLTIIMIGAVVTTAATLGVLPALYPLAVGVVAVAIVRGRRSWLAAFR
jgi:uncharacterized membrane protein YphA (DoxX/SURF4 family)